MKKNKSNLDGVASKTQSEESNDFFELPFEKSRRGGNISSEDDPLGIFDADEKPKETAKPLPRLGKPSVSNLSKSRPAPPKLSREDETRLILAAQAGDNAAGNRLVDCHIANLRALARHYLGDMPAHKIDDLVEAALLAFWVCVRRWQPGNGNGLNAFYQRAVDGALAKMVHEISNSCGFPMESNVQRYIRHHSDADVFELLKVFPARSRAELEFELGMRAGTWATESYSEADGDGEEDDSPRRGTFEYGVGASDFTSQCSRLHLSNKIEIEAGLRPGSWADAAIANYDAWLAAKIQQLAAEPNGGRCALAQYLVKRNNKKRNNKKAAVQPSRSTPLAESGAVISPSMNHFEPKRAKPAAKDTECPKSIGESGRRHLSNTTSNKSPAWRDAA